MDPERDGDASVGPPSWWIKRRAESGPRAYRLSGGLWRKPLIGDTPPQGGTAMGYWGSLRPDSDMSSTLRNRYKRRFDALKKAGYLLAPRQAEAPAGDTWEIVRVVEGRGGSRQGGIVVRASARFVEAYRRAQDNRAYELVSTTLLFLPPGTDRNFGTASSTPRPSWRTRL